ncbi:MAG: cyclopropane-fatty-acyl-phospholipid synthase family protein [Acidobacteriia bacterium]|nr:cyclopropane-fatty-acyl-phospholipid synthase family protein [Terriglobia bacterium]
MGALAENAVREVPAHAAIELFDTLLARYGKGDLQVRLWDGSACGAGQPRCTLVIKHPDVVRRMCDCPNEQALGEAYVCDEFDIKGDIGTALEFGDSLFRQEFPLADRLRIAALLRRLPAGGRLRLLRPALRLHGWLHSKERDREAIRYHYDLPTEFYALWLDPRLVYSCAYFQTPQDDLEAAQVRKLDYICRKLRLCRGERLLDIGCGWGALVLHAAEHYGVDALGITLSARQAEVAGERIRASGLATTRCHVELRDYRDLEGREQFDKIASVGMFEHVGKKLLPEYFARAWQLLKPGGVFLNHGIAYSATWPLPKPSFSDTYVFPDGELAPINESLRAAEIGGFEVRDVESLREHYTLTLKRWVHRLEEHAEQARRITNDSTYRIWRLYMAGSAHRFASGRVNIYQTLLAKPEHGDSRLPLARDDWYRE